MPVSGGTIAPSGFFTNLEFCLDPWREAFALASWEMRWSPGKSAVLAAGQLDPPCNATCPRTTHGLI